MTHLVRCDACERLVRTGAPCPFCNAPPVARRVLGAASALLLSGCFSAHYGVPDSEYGSSGPGPDTDSTSGSSSGSSTEGTTTEGTTTEGTTTGSSTTKGSTTDGSSTSPVGGTAGSTSGDATTTTTTTG
ncbi:MAG: hypothetical protein ACE37F_29425 [Nannocystaceae bacterium]|nr:hypothetical protein [bacterium]